MARSRNIKPGLFSNDELAECDIYARFLFTGLWTIADKAGRLEDRPKKIKVQILPYDKVNCDDLLNQLFKHGFIRRYTVNNKNYIQISNWIKHQNPHKNENESEIPKPPFSVEKDDGEDIHFVAMGKSTSIDNIGTHPADSLNLITDSSSLIPDSLNLVHLYNKPLERPMAYAFYGEVIKLSYSDIGKWKLRYPKINLHHPLSRLNLEFQGVNN